MLEYISVDKIEPHPDNPRKNLGALSELAESIKAKGILQNLTVMPSPNVPGKYRVVIGHRRLAASKLAGLEEVPCSISHMDHKEQVATMLLENMQRSDLTPYEQAQGFQMMLDLGETVTGIAEKTGFSSTTIRHRVKLLELDQKKLKKSSERGATLQDFLKLEKVEDVDARNRVLEKVGTSNFDYELKRALDHEESVKRMAQIIADVEKFATRVENVTNDMRWVGSYYPSANREVKRPQDADTVESFFRADPYAVTAYKKGPYIGEDDSKSEKRKELQERVAKLDEITKRAYGLRLDFMKKFTGVKKLAPVAMEYAVRMWIDSYASIDTDIFADILGLKIDNKNDIRFEDVVKQSGASTEAIFSAAVYSAMDDSGKKYYDWQGLYRSDDDLDMVYDFLEKFGYQMSDEERAMREAAHEGSFRGGNSCADIELYSDPHALKK